MERQEALDYIKAQDPESGERLKRLVERKSLLLDKNIYGERFTERQFDMVFDPLLRSAYEKARILELLERRGPHGCIAGARPVDGQGTRLQPPEGPDQEEHG